MSSDAEIRQQDIARLKHIAVEFCGMDNDLNDQSIYTATNLARCFASQGIVGFNKDFIGLSGDDVDDFQVPSLVNGQPSTPLPAITKRKLKMVTAFFHYCSRRNKHAINLAGLDRVAFGVFQLNHYDPNAQVVPWKVKLPGENDALSNWMRTIKPTPSDYKDFKEDAKWIAFKERFLTTLESHGLLHLIDPTFVVVDEELDKRQRGWLYKVMQDKIQCAQGKAIVTRHLKRKTLQSFGKS